MIRLVLLAILASGMAPTASGQSDGADLVVSDRDKFLIFGGFAAAIVGILLYLARDIILRKRSPYDTEEMESKKERTFEKYHSDWGDDYEEIGQRRHTRQDKEFREMAAGGRLPDYYGILGVPSDATQDEIKSRYRELAKRTHPDRTGQGSEDEMAEINEAYETLSDGEERRRYDRYFARD